MGAVVSVNPGSRRTACGTMSVRAVRRLTGPARTAAHLAEPETPTDCICVCPPTSRPAMRDAQQMREVIEPTLCIHRPRYVLGLWPRQGTRDHHPGRPLLSCLRHRAPHRQRRAGSAAHAHACHTPRARRRRGQLVDMRSRGDLAVERDPDSALRKRSGAPSAYPGQPRTTDPPAVSEEHEGEKPMEAMREETQAEEPQIGQERAQSEARLGSLAVLQRRIRELLPTLPAAVALGHQAPVRDALAVMRQKQLSCVLVVERGQLVGVFTERDVVTKVAATPLDVDHVPLRDVMQPDPECPAARR